MTQTSDETAWRPILSGAASDKAWHAIRLVARELENGHDARNDDPWIALLYAYLALETGEAQFESIANRRLDEAINGLEHVRGSALFGGLAGTGWVSAHIDTLANSFVAGGQNDDDYADIDEFLVSLSLSSLDCELIAGVAGLAVYWLERLPARSAVLALEQIVQHLKNTADQSAAGWTWRKPVSKVPLHVRHQYPTGQYNLGASHGVPGVVSVLARIASEGIAAQNSRRLAEGAADWVLSQGTKENGWAFPPFVGDLPMPLLKWCYGPLGIAGTLMVAACTLDLSALKQQSLEIAVACTKRRAELKCVKDPGLCHGAAGIAHVFNRMAQLSGSEFLLDAARDSYECVLDLFDPRRGIGGFRYWVPPREGRGNPFEPPPPEWSDDATFLEGSAGTALALLAAVSPLAPKWDRVLGLSA